MITTFLDESGTHGGSLCTVMAGYLGTKEQWTAVEERWKKMLAANPDVSVVHGKDFFPRHTPYRNWSDDKYNAFLAEIISTLRESHVGAIISALSNVDYRKYRHKFKGVQSVCDSAYGICFRKCMVTIAGHFSHTEHRVSFIVESGHSNKGDASRIFHHTKRCANKYVHMSRYQLGEFDSAEKKDYGILQAADLLSHMTHKHLEKFLATGDSLVSPTHAAILDAAPYRDFWITAEELLPMVDVFHSVQRDYRAIKALRWATRRKGEPFPRSAPPQDVS